MQKPKRGMASWLRFSGNEQLCEMDGITLLPIFVYGAVFIGLLSVEARLMFLRMAESSSCVQLIFKDGNRWLSLKRSVMTVIPSFVQQLIDYMSISARGFQDLKDGLMNVSAPSSPTYHSAKMELNGPAPSLHTFRTIAFGESAIKMEHSIRLHTAGATHGRSIDHF